MKNANQDKPKLTRREFARTLAGAGALLAMGSRVRATSAATKKSVENTPVILECAITGSTTKTVNPLGPETAKEQTAEIIRCLDADATIIHSHSNQPSLVSGCARERSEGQGA